MSTRRILGIAIFSILIIVVLIGAMLLTSYLTRDNDAIPLPEASEPVRIPDVAAPDTLDRVEVTRDTIQAVISTLKRPEVYSRSIRIGSYWDGGQVEYIIHVSVANAVTSLQTSSSAGVEKRIIITPEKLYVWYAGDSAPYIGAAASGGSGYKAADEWQMIITYEDVLEFNKDDIIDAGYIQYGEEDCVFAVCRSPMLGYTYKYYVSIEFGLLTGAEEYDETGELVYIMTAGRCESVADPVLFILPDGTVIATTE